jgi:hypothetical protein
MRLKSGPQDLPSGKALAWTLMLLYIAQGFLASMVLNESDAAPRTILAVAVQIGAITALLNFRNLALRLPQTISALAGTGFYFGLISIVILTQADPEKTQPDLALIYLALFIWSLLVDAHIYRHALSIKLGQGMLVAVTIFIANYVLLKSVFG